MTADKLEHFKNLIKDFPQDPGVYLMKNIKEKVIYVGKAKNLKARVRSYFQNNADHSTKTKFLINQIETVEFVLTKTEVEAFLLEASLIKKYRPRYNVRLKDDKAYPYIRFGMDHDFPRLYISRKVKNDGAIYFGPYTSGLAVRETIRFINRTYKIRDCRDAFMRARTRPCMTYQIGRCTAPCVDLVTKLEYGKDVKSALQFLRGENTKVIKELTQRMKEASKAERFEAAGKLRDSIRAVEVIWEKQTVVSTSKEKDQDVIAYVGDPRGTLIEVLNVRAGRVLGSQPHFIAKFDCNSTEEEPKDWLVSFLNQYYLENFVPDEVVLPVDLGLDIAKLFQAVLKERHNKQPKISPAVGEDGRQLIELTLTNAKAHFNDQVSKRDSSLKALVEIQEKLHLPELPLRIECFDISNFQGADSVASQVVFEEGMPKKEDYRHYKIKTVEGANDFASMKEVISRRFKHQEYDEPQLILIDGGKGQLKMALEALKEVGVVVPVVGIAKSRVEGEFSDAEVKSSQERFFLPGRQNAVTFAKNSQGLQILVGLRDEAHRFAITFHRKLRDKTSLTSELDFIVGLGEKRKQALLKRFDTIEAIRQAGVEEIAKLKGFNRILAQRIMLQLEV